jgi:very-short-patch-repair endonuclease
MLSSSPDLSGEVASEVEPEGAVLRPGAKVKFARDLRRAMTKPEVMLWMRLRSRSEGFSFRRQHPIRPYIADFYCARARLIVEVDGEGHGFGDQPYHDEIRDRYFADKQIETMRIAAVDILRDPDDMADGIVRYIR